MQLNNGRSGAAYSGRILEKKRPLRSTDLGGKTKEKPRRGGATAEADDEAAKASCDGEPHP